MNQNNRFCKRKGHEELQIYHICTLLECNQRKRWCCSECISQEIHKHSKPNNSHIMKTKELLFKLKSESDELNEDLGAHKMIKSSDILIKILTECQRLENSLIDYRKSIEGQLQNIQQQQAKFKYDINNLDVNNFEQLDDIKINELLKTNTQELNHNLNLLPLDDFKKQIHTIELIIKDYQNNKNNNSNQIIDFKDRKYITQEIDQTYGVYYALSISKNEQYVAYGGYDQLLSIYDIKLNKKIKEIKLYNFLYVCQFTQDTSQLFVGLNGGYVCGYNVENNFKVMFKQQIHSLAIYDIITIQNIYLITSSQDKSIIKTDIKRKKIIFKLTGHTNSIFAIDYNQKDDLIASGSDDKSLKLWNCRNRGIIINKEQSCNNAIRQIQLVNNNQNILSLDLYGNLYKWNIDLIGRGLIGLWQFCDHKINNFYQVNQDQNLLLICHHYVSILNQQGQIINQIWHYRSGNNILPICFDCRQLDNLQYILIRTQDKIILGIAQN